MSRLQQSSFLLWSPDGVTQPVNSALQFGAQEPASFPFNLDGYATSTSFTSVPFRLWQVDKYGITFSTPAGSTAAGTIAFQACEDVPWHDDTTDANLVDWFPVYFIPGSGGAAANVFNYASGANLLNFKEPWCEYRYVRMVVVVSSGAGLFKTKINIKGVI